MEFIDFPNASEGICIAAIKAKDEADVVFMKLRRESVVFDKMLILGPIVFG
jgi:hypothetical protein